MLERPDSTFLEHSPVAIESRQGDWQAYLQQRARCHGNEEMINYHYGSAIVYQRQCALVYLGNRAQFHGGVCSKKHPRVLTPKLLSDLERMNKAKRYSRYPWMETLLNLLSEIEQIQDQPVTGNVISLVPHKSS